jgi:hypothetical protein
MTKPKPKHLLQKPGRKPTPPEQRKHWTLADIRAHCFITVTDCWEYRPSRRHKQGPRQEFTDRFITVHHGGERVLLRRLAWSLVYGPVPEGKGISPAKCGNPRCHNPMHCKPVTEREKSQLASARGSFSTPHRILACALGKQQSAAAKLDPEKVRQIRAIEGPAYKHCADFGISAGMFNRVRSGKAWSNVT